MTPVAKRRQNCPRYQLHRWQIVRPISLVSLTPVANLELQISPRIFEKIRNDPNGILRGLGETDPGKKPEVENLVTLSL